MNRRPHVPMFRPKTQQGATLVVVLILLLVMTLLGLASLRGTVLEERMSANLLDRSLAFQVAESALREAETRLQVPPAFPTNGCNAGMCAHPVLTATDRWLDSNFNGWVDATQVENKASAPQYFIEDLGLGVNWPMCDALPPAKRSPLCKTPRYRITSRSAIQAGRASVILQAMYAGK